MITFKEFMQESSLSRIKSKSDKGGIGILSGSRGDKSAKENRARAKQLDKDIRGKFGRGATLARTRKGGLPKRNIPIGKMKPQGKSPEGQTQIKGKTFTYG